MTLLQDFQKFIRDHKLFQAKDRLLIAVSGGVDSVVLCDLCKQAGYDFVIAHCNFQLRGSDSDADETFVKNLGDAYGVEVVVQKFDTANFASENRLSVQVAARELRYSWFAEIMKASSDQPINCLLTAHHANDNIETLLMNFFKGTGIAGLQGIPLKQRSPSDGFIVRPLLFAKKTAISEYATLNGLEYREDASNSDSKYTRNYFRNELIPSLKKVYPAVEDNLLANIERLREVNLIYRQAIDNEKKKLLVAKGNEIHLPVLRLLKSPALQTIVYEISKDYGFSPQQATEIVKLLHAPSGKYVQSASHRILRNRAWLIISRSDDSASEHHLIENADSQIQFTNGQLSLEKTANAGNISTDSKIVMLDNSEIAYPLLLRKWKQGDYFYPLGMKKKKKLSRFFSDQKRSLFEKETTWVLESNKKIIWVVGHRIDDRFKILSTTKEILKITLTPSK